MGMKSAWEKRTRRREEMNGNVTDAEEADDNVTTRELETAYAEMMEQPKGDKSSGRRKRGGTFHRQLETPDFDFQIKMYWKEGYCVTSHCCIMSPI